MCIYTASFQSALQLSYEVSSLTPEGGIRIHPHLLLVTCPLLLPKTGRLSEPEKRPLSYSKSRVLIMRVNCHLE